MERCAVCNDQKKKNGFDARLTFDVTPAVLSHSAFVNRCESCLVILEGFRQGGQTLYQKDFQRLARTITARCCAQHNGRADTLVLETYFYDDRPKLELELYSVQPHRTLIHISANSANLQSIYANCNHQLGRRYYLDLPPAATRCQPSL